MQIWNASEEHCWRYRADTILSTDRQTDRVKPVPPFQLRWSGRYNKVALFYFPNAGHVYIRGLNFVITVSVLVLPASTRTIPIPKFHTLAMDYMYSQITSLDQMTSIGGIILLKWRSLICAGTRLDHHCVSSPKSLDDIFKWKRFPRYWPCVRGIHRYRWIPLTKASYAELWCFLSAPEWTIE